MSLNSIFSKVKQFKYLWFFWLFVMILALFILVLMGSYELSVKVNNQSSLIFDYFFKYITFIGDGALLYILSFVLIIFSRKWALMYIISLIVTTIFVQFLKRLLFDNFYRPSRYFKDLIDDGSWHLVDGVELYDRFSFPSGHTALSFCFIIIICYFLKSNFWSLLLILLAFLVGFSRIYLTQHFLIDVWFGSLIGSLISLIVITYFEKFISKLSFIND